MKTETKGNPKMKAMQQLYEKKDLTFEDLSVIRKQLRQRIDSQQEHIMVSARRLIPFSGGSSGISLKNKGISPLSLITTPIRKGKAISLVEGMVIGYKLVRSIRRIIRK